MLNRQQTGPLKRSTARRVGYSIPGPPNMIDCYFQIIHNRLPTQLVLIRAVVIRAGSLCCMPLVNIEVVPRNHFSSVTLANFFQQILLARAPE